MPLIRTLNLTDADGIYAAVVGAHRGLTAAESAALNARLVLLLANHIADAEVICEAIDAAQRTPAKARTASPQYA